MMSMVFFILRSSQIICICPISISVNLLKMEEAAKTGNRELVHKLFQSGHDIQDAMLPAIQEDQTELFVDTIRLGAKVTINEVLNIILRQNNYMAMAIHDFENNGVTTGIRDVKFDDVVKLVSSFPSCLPIAIVMYL